MTKTVLPIFHVAAWLQRTHQTSQLATRELAKAWRVAMESQLSQMAGDAVLTIDFTGVEALDYTAADEGVVKLIRRVNAGEYGQIALALTGTTASHEHNLAVALERNKMAVVLQRKDGPEILGWLERFLRRAFLGVVAHAPVTSRQLADVWGVHLTTVAEDLRRLYTRRLVFRCDERLAGGGWQYVYRPVEGQVVSLR